MNLEQRQRVMQAIRKREALIAWALKNGDKDEAKRIRTELDELFAAAFRLHLRRISRFTLDIRPDATVQYRAKGKYDEEDTDIVQARLHGRARNGNHRRGESGARMGAGGRGTGDRQDRRAGQDPAGRVLIA